MLFYCYYYYKFFIIRERKKREKSSTRSNFCVKQHTTKDDNKNAHTHHTFTDGDTAGIPGVDSPNSRTLRLGVVGGL